MVLKVLTMKIMCEECDIEEAKKELSEWYYSNTNIGMEDISFFIQNK